LIPLARQPSQPLLIPINEADVARVAGIIGSASASALALAELHRRRAAGETVGLFQDPQNPTFIIVGPFPAGTP